MGVEELPVGLRGLRLRVIVDDYEGHPPVPPGTVVNAIGDSRRPDFLVIELDSPIEVPRRSAPGAVAIRHLAVSQLRGWEWDWEMLFRPPAEVDLPRGPDEAVPFTPLFVKVWHVFDPRLATSQEWTTDTMVYVAKGSLTKTLVGQRT